MAKKSDKQILDNALKSKEFKALVKKEKGTPFLKLAVIFLLQNGLSHLIDLLFEGKKHNCE
jgi:hypothetical protein